jgi:mannose-6-phosphate isomerase-like protein (cupin superfamily)
MAAVGLEAQQRGDVLERDRLDVGPGQPRQGRRARRGVLDLEEVQVPPDPGWRDAHRGFSPEARDPALPRERCALVRPTVLPSIMPIDIKRVDVRRFDPAKMQKVNLFETPRFFCDVYCLEPGQAQKPHRHDGADKVYAVLEGEVLVRVGGESATLSPGAAALAPAGVDHGIENPGKARAAVLVFMAPRP